MSNRTGAIFGLLAIAAIAGFGAWQWQQGQRPAAAPQAPPPSVISSAAVEQEYWQPALRSVGSLVAVNRTEVSTEVNGIVREIAFESAQRVRKGEVLIRLDDAVDRAALEALRAERRLAEVQFKRFDDLMEKKVTSKSEYDESRARFDAANALVKQQEAVIERKTIRAPFTGLLGIREVSLGQYLEAGESIVALEVLNPIYVDYTLPERHYGKVRPGQPVRLKLDAVAGRGFTGEVSAIDAGVDTGTRTLRVRATLDNLDGVLRPGMFAEVETVTGEALPVLTLPRTAVSFNTYGDFVFVINETGADGADKPSLTVRRTPIKAGEIRGGRAAVEGLALGTRVARAGTNKLRDGAAVSIDNRVQLDDRVISGE